MKINEVIERLIDFHQPYKSAKTRDTVKYGDPDKECTGIVTTVYGSSDVIRKAHELGCNLVISHESIFFGDEFDPETFKGLKAYEEKKKLLEETGIVVWRDHDHMHGQGKNPWHPEMVRTRNDYIFYGLMKVLGWDEYVTGDTLKPLWYKLPEMTVRELAEDMMKKMNLNGCRIVGDLDSKVSTVFVCEHCNGRGDEAKIMQSENADVLIPLEINDWTVTTAIREANMFRAHKAIIEFGHFNVEEAGMKYMAETWLKDVVKNEMPVYFVQSGDSFIYLTRRHEQ